jgi:allantoinase
MTFDRFPYSPITRRPPIRWPNGARVAVWVGVNIEAHVHGKPAISNTSIFPLTRDLVPDPFNEGWRMYGTRVGIWRMIDVIDNLSLPTSVLLNSDVCHLFPEIIEEGTKRNWVWLGHGKNNSTDQIAMSYENETTYLQSVTDAIIRGTGQKPKGWLGPALTETENTPDILAELGYTYICDWPHDDQPVPMNVSRGQMITVPYSVELNDIPLFVGKNLTGEDFCRIVADQFDVLYEESAESGRVMSLPLHPFVVNVPFRHKYLERALRYLVEHEGAWVTTADAIADYYYEHYYDEAVAGVAATDESTGER